MKRLVVDVDEQYMNLVVDLLSNLKENIVKNITIQTSHVNPINKKTTQLNRFHELISKSNNKIPLTMEIATNTDGMV